ncbi:extracellular solute-binding protein [Virgisporangium aurantiacum]|uniref:Sugar ABC transporter substrate-binding protein n=1 Tax=Virgisporangium aurantiacum TaxID=175570 RepID=A0A8J3Z5R7_9ACTN|nr:extracellular solute-binding protein [Virgisporangium aurantiacum]GIJ55761.1 sugar ABC transporter substrate-binding protein [Virgisporangium aurantiacum]
MNGPTHPLTRRGLLRASLLGAGAAALGTAGCSEVGAGLANTELDPGSISYWNLFGGGDGVRMQQMLDGYRKANPGTDLEAVTLSWGNPYYTKLSLSTVGDQPPHVAVSHLTRMKTLVQADLLQELKPEDLDRHGMSPDKFNRRAWDAGLVDGKAYAIPIDTHPFVLFYNTDICEKAGLLDGNKNLKEIKGPDAFADALTKVKAVTGKFGATHGITSDTASPWRFFQTLYSQLGGEVLADNGTRIVLDDAKARQVLDYMRALTVEKGLIPGNADYQSAIALFAQGQSGFHLNGEWEITTFQTAKMPFGMTLVPNIFGGAYAVQADSHTLVLPVRPDQDRAMLDRSFGFVKSMLDQSLTWAEGGHVPIWQPFATSDAYRKLTPQSNYAAAADAAVYDPPGWYSGSGSNFEIIMGSAIGAMEAGQSSPADAISQIRSKLSVLAATPSPV